MRRHALLIGCSAKKIKGEKTIRDVSLDLNSYKNYLTSSIGGGWEYNSSNTSMNEITILEDADYETILERIDDIKKQEYDLVFTVFSGHGDFDNVDNYCRRFLVGPNQFINEKQLNNLSKKQILIFDSCSGLRISKIKSLTEELEKASKSIAKDYDKLKQARIKYEKWCETCNNQVICLYAAEIDSSARSKGKGGYYTNALLKVLNNSRQDIDIVDAHYKACKIVEVVSKGLQKPDIDIPRTRKFLPGAIHV